LEYSGINLAGLFLEFLWRITLRVPLADYSSGITPEVYLAYFFWSSSQKLL